MSDDSRQNEDLSREALNVSPENKPFTGQQWQGGKQLPGTTPVKPPENANMMAGGTEHTAGGKVPDVSIQNALGSIKMEEFTAIHKRPCVRDAFLTGIGAAFAIGGVRALFGARIWSACNWAVGSWAIGSGVQYQYCHYKRQAEKEGMMRAVEILNKKDMEKKAREARKEKAREERRKAKEEEQDAQYAALNSAQSEKPEGSGKSWWKPW